MHGIKRRLFVVVIIDDSEWQRSWRHLVLELTAATFARSLPDFASLLIGYLQASVFNAVSMQLSSDNLRP